MRLAFLPSLFFSAGMSGIGSGAPPATTATDDLGEGSKRFIHGLTVWEDIENGRVNDNDITALSKSGCRHTTHTIGEIVLRPHRVLVRSRLLPVRILAHTVASLAASLDGPK